MPAKALTESEKLGRLSKAEPAETTPNKPMPKGNKRAIKPPVEDLQMGSLTTAPNNLPAPHATSPPSM